MVSGILILLGSPGALRIHPFTMRNEEGVQVAPIFYLDILLFYIVIYHSDIYKCDMNIQNIILGLLQNKPKTGYELKREFDQSLGFFSGASFGSIYPILKKIERQAMVTMNMEVQDGKPNKKVYSITEKGKSAFQDAMRETLTISPYKNEFMTRLFFYSALGPGERMDCTAEYLSFLQEKLEVLRALKPYVEETADAYQLMCYH